MFLKKIYKRVSDKEVDKKMMNDINFYKRLKKLCNDGFNI